MFAAAGAAAAALSLHRILLVANLVLGFAAASVSASASPSTRYLKRQYEPATTCQSPVQRRSWTALSNREKLSYLNAVKCLQETAPGYGIHGARSVWEELQWTHIKSKNWIHGVAAFLPWHRYYLRAHEMMLSQHCNYTLGVPYWEMSLDVENLAGAEVWDPQYGFGGDGHGENNCVMDGPFANLTLTFNDDGMPATPECLRRKFNSTQFARAAQSEIDICLRNRDWAGASGCYENWLHIAGHEGVGQVMADALLAPGDPIFFLHHANIDRLWYQWTSSGPPERLMEMGRPNTPSEEFNAANRWATPGPEWTDFSGDDGPETTLNHVLWVADMVPNVTIGDVMDLRSPVSCAEYV